MTLVVMVCIERSLKDFGISARTPKGTYDNSKDVVTVGIQEDQNPSSKNSTICDEGTADNKHDCNITVSSDDTTHQENNVKVDNVSNPYILNIEFIGM